LSSPSDDGGLLEFFEFNPNRRRNSLFSALSTAFSATSRALSASRSLTRTDKSSRRAVSPTTTAASSS
jgi:hypothetical protein